VTKLGTLVAAAALGAAVLSSSIASAQEGAPAQEAPKPAAATTASSEEVVERYPPSSVRWKVLIAGITLTGLGYGGMALMGGLWDGVPGGDYLYIPLAGPWVALGKSGCTPDESAPVEGTVTPQTCGGMQALRGIIYVVGSLVQLGGLGLVGESIFMTTESPDAAPVKKTAILPMPIITQDSVGLGVIGTF